MLLKAAENGLINGLGDDIIIGGVISLKCADDTILVVDRNLEYAENLKWILNMF
jgi:hypothetical protein